MKNTAVSKLCLITLLASLSACSTVTGGFNQDVKIETQTADGTLTPNAACVMQRGDKEPTEFLSGQTVSVRRDSEDVSISCSAPDQAAAEGRLISRFRKLAASGNLIFGSVAGIITDVATGNSYGYPEWVRLVHGENRIYDAADSESDQPNTGKLADE